MPVGILRAFHVAAIAVALSAPAGAHHSFAPVDLNTTITIEGEVTEFQWTNPHCWIEIDVADAGGGVVHWSVELNSPNQLTRQGWRRDDIVVGDRLTVALHPLRNGRAGGMLSHAVLANGAERRAAYSQTGGDPNRRTPR